MPNHDPQAPAIELAHLTFAYEGSAPQLEDVNLTVQPGEVVVLTGPSGGGKSTLDPRGQRPGAVPSTKAS
mgnify:CR=1 FL=1